MSYLIENLARPVIRTLPTYNAGMSSEVVRARYKVNHIAKLASNENPLGCSPRVASSLAGLEKKIAIYPDAASTELRQALAAACAISADRIVIGNGSENLIELLSLAFLHPGDRVVSVTPSFGLHEICPRMMGAEVTMVPMDHNMQFDLAGMIAALKATPTKMLIFSNPSNPVGAMLVREDFDALINSAPEDCLLVIDEAYYEYAVKHADYPDSLQSLGKTTRPWIVLRTFSKAYGLAGLRVGYGLCSSPVLAQLLNKVRGPFNLNVVAQIAAIAALSDQTHVSRSGQHVEQERERMRHALEQMGLRVAPSQANLLFFELGVESSVVSEALLRTGVIVKGWREAGYTRWVRVSVGTATDNNLFLEALSGVLTGTLST